MGKSPGKWMKTLIFGKKSSRSKRPKPNDKKKCGDGKQVPVSLDQIGNTNPSLSVSQISDGKIEDDLQSDHSQENVRNPSLNVSQISDGKIEDDLQSDHSQEKIRNPSLSISQISDGKIEDDPQSDHSQEKVRTLAPANQTVCITETEPNAEYDSDRVREEQTATVLQAALRGYLARRTFRSLKGIIRLQALIRGHLVRRQAISTLYSMFQIVKLQALARGRKIRHSDIGVEVQTRCTGVNLAVICSVGVEVSLETLKLSSNGFARKIVASSISATSLHFHYDPNDTNSVISWLERWSTSQCWQLLSKPKLGQRSKSKKLHTRTSSVSNVEIITSEFDKPIRNTRKVISNETANLIEENPELMLERIKRNLRKVNIPVLQSTTVQTETEAETENMNGYDNIEKITAPPEKFRVIETETVIISKNEKEDEKVNDRKKSRRRVSVPMNQEFMENNEPLQIKRSVPSYMAATVSAKAKLRVQDAPETPTILNRRYSLPSLTNARVSVSPRLQTTGKLKNDRSLQLSRDGNVKVNQAEWRR